MKPHLILLPLALVASSSQAQPPVKAQEIYSLPSIPYLGVGEQSPLEKAIIADDVPQILQLLKANPKLRNSMGMRHDGLRFGYIGSPLRFAIDRNKPKVARALLETGSDANQDYLLGLALSRKDESWKPLAELLIEHGAQVSPPVTNEYNEPPLVSLLNVPFQTREKWDFLLQHGADPLMRASTPRVEKELLLERAFAKKNSAALAAMLAVLPLNIHFTIYSYSYMHTPKDERTPWDLAVKHQNVAALKQLIARGADLEARDIRGRTALYHAVEYRGEMMQALLTAGARVTDEVLNHAIDCATTSNPKASPPVEFLTPLLARAKVAPHSPWTYSPLLRALRSSNADILQLLLKAQPPTDDRERFFLAASTSDLNTLQRLNRKTPRLILSSLPDGQTPLHFALSWGQVETVRFLVSHGANVNAPDKTGRTPLHLAAGNSEPANVRFLLSRGAKVNATDADQLIPIHYALYNAKAGRLLQIRQTISILLEAGTDANNPGVRNYGYSEPIFVSAIERGDAEIVRLFLDHGAKVTKPIWGSTTALGVAVEKMSNWEADPKTRPVRMEVVKLLLNRGANPKDKAQLGGLLLGNALLYDQHDFELARLLLSHGAGINDLNSPDPAYPDTPAIVHVLHIPEKLRFALEQGANPNVNIGDGQSLLESICRSFWGASDTHIYSGATPPMESRVPPSIWLQSGRLLLETKRVSLHSRPSQTPPMEFAVYAESPDMLKLLLEFGGDPNEKNDAGKTPLDIARQNGKTEMVELMEKAIASQHTGH